ncbi:endonuclease/exonuclease/phosphatase family protein [Campylobacter sp. RM12327]|uniref:endonuclease/exonuclease/phosphatase family protein n=1 Tax=Campylobacter sputorum TaxID=206 RepID=UPI000B7769EF|nr:MULTISPECIES: endonuclease/exonuclease/phosphatase family protein [Campylobacter]ASM40486.1 endonuclease/Exonuclease/phosphatase family protein [Campylobacter sputorum]MBE7357239.1 endonuclease/exonuclease/phosphatase family protein [Campylobacter sp. RM11302]MBF6668549.1 endonuclease/exonuclease/phosphatase family protein [Campylobacter sp. RM12327]MBF6674196.1 endonuclease/exonuclease/phosphatase family protein [Campylobacter sp. RM13538]MBF6675665.1 endonuclease/exonuclease/phosphatase f
MKKIFLLIISFVFLYSSELKIATYNVENLFDDKFDGTEYYDFNIKKSSWNTKKYQEKLSNLSEVINKINPDIIALQEVENYSTLQDLAKQSGYKFYKFTKDKTSPFGVGVMSKIEILSTKNYAVKSVKTRDILRADFKFDDSEFSIFINHFPAAKNPIRHRKAAATTLYQAINETIKNGKKNLILLGDFNSDLGDNFLLNDIIRINKFTNLWDEVPVNSQISHKSRRAIDHVLLSQSFFESSPYYKKGSFGICKADINYFEISDHLPLCFSINSEKTSIDLATKTINEIYKNQQINTKTLIQKAAVIYKDEAGYVISQGHGESVFVFDKNAVVDVGKIYDLIAYKSEIYDGNFEITSAKIINSYDKITNIDKYKIDFKNINEARSGDIITNIVGDVKNGYLHTEFGKIKLFSRSKKLNDNLDLKEALFWNYKGQKELIIK